MTASNSRLVDLVRRSEERFVPLTAMLELTHRCNLRCGHCYIPDLGTTDTVSTDRWLSLLDELADSGTLFLTLTGGEVLCRRGWMDVARRARELGFCLRLFTNATLVDEQVADVVAGLSVAVEVSFHSMDPKVFDRATGVESSFARARRGVELLRARQVEVRLKVPMTRITRYGVGAVAEYAEQIGAEFFSDPRIVPATDGAPDPLRMRVPPADLGGYYRGPYSQCEAPAVDWGDGRETGPVCAAGVRLVNVAANGDVTACGALPEVAGNINQGSFQDIWTGSPWLTRLRRLRRGDLEDCDRCPSYTFCQRCPAQALAEDGDLLGPSRWSCEHAAALWEAFDRGA